jgi:hypothetical protein
VPSRCWSQPIGVEGRRPAVRATREEVRNVYEFTQRRERLCFALRGERPFSCRTTKGLLLNGKQTDPRSGRIAGPSGVHALSVLVHSSSLTTSRLGRFAPDPR